MRREARPAAAVAPERLPRSRVVRVLVVEDNHDSAESFKMVIELAGHEVQNRRLRPDGAANPGRVRYPPSHSWISDSPR
jgi:hypothetical protein